MDVVHALAPQIVIHVIVDIFIIQEDVYNALIIVYQFISVANVLVVMMVIIYLITNV